MSQQPPGDPRGPVPGASPAAGQGSSVPRSGATPSFGAPSGSRPQSTEPLPPRSDLMDAPGRSGGATAASAPRPTPRQSPRPSAPDPSNPLAWADDLDADIPTDWDTPEPTPQPPRPPRRAPATSTAKPTARRPASPAIPAMSVPQLRVPAALAQGDLAKDRLTTILLLASVISAVMMLLMLALRVGSLPGSLVLHLDAAGLPDQWGPSRVLWRIPLIALGVTAMNAVLAWFLAPMDRFASRFVLGAALVVQLVAWVALFDFL